MGMSTCIWGLRERTKEHERMVKVARELQELDMSPTPELLEYFKGTDYVKYGEPIDDDEGLEIYLDDEQCENYKDRNRNCDGYEIDIKKLPKGVVRIRFENSW